MSREDLKLIVKDLKRYASYPNSDSMTNEILNYLAAQTSCTRLTDLIFYTDLSDGEIVDEMLKDKPIEL